MREATATAWMQNSGMAKNKRNPKSVLKQTTERYLGCKQRLRNAVNDKIGLEPAES
jgi:hypothetical protein